jgi:hypothetical protein
MSAGRTKGICRDAQIAPLESMTMFSAHRFLAIAQAGWPRRAVVFSLFAAMFVVGISVFRDYGYPTDDGTEHYSSLVAAKRISAAFGHVPARLEKVQDIEHYRDRYYGTAIQMVPTFVEIAWGLEASRDILLVRHFWTFLVYFASIVCFYRLCLRLFPTGPHALLGTLMVFLYPRFFAHSFYNIKDIGFCALFTISLLACIAFLQDGRRVHHAIVAGALVALAANARFYAFVLLAGTLLLMAIEDSRNPAATNERRPYILFAASFATSFILLTPASWSNPLLFPFEYVAHFIDFKGWNGSMLSDGQLFRKESMPRYYILVWYAISVPLAYILLFFAGVFALVEDVVSPDRRTTTTRTIRLFVAALFFLPIVATMLHRGLLYIEWRHLYFTFPLFVILALAGLEYALGRAPRPLRIAALGAIGLSLLTQAAWIARNHPYEYAYLNVAGRPFGDRFDRDYWGLCQKQLLEWLSSHAASMPTRIAYVAGPQGSQLIFPEDMQKQFEIVEPASAEYAVTSFQRVAGNTYSVEGFEEVHAVVVNGYKIGAVYKALPSSGAADSAGTTAQE